MGLREKVTITLVIIAVIQIACRHCMPRSTRKASLKRYLNDLKPVTNNPASTPYSTSRLNKTPKQTLGRTAQHARISQNSLPSKSLYQTYNFPENEYPLDNSPRDAFRTGMNFQDNFHVNNLQKGARNMGSSAINDLKKEMKMKRKLLSNREINNGGSQLQREMSARKLTPSPDSVRLFDLETFPEVQYPLNTMDTWGPNYWNYLPFTQEKQLNGFHQQIFNSKTRESFNKPFTRLSKATASKFLQSYDKLKEEQIRTSTENSKRSNVGQTGLNFTKTATCEKVSDDFITASLVSNIPSQSSEIKKTLESTCEIMPSLENTCPVTEYSYHLMPIPYKVIEERIENVFPVCEVKNNTEELQDANNSAFEEAIQFIQEMLLSDDTSSAVPPENISAVEKNMNISDDADVPAMENIPTTLMERAKSYTIIPPEELSQDASDDTADILQNSMPSYSADIIVENITTVAEPLNVIMPLPFNEPIKYEALTNVPNSGPALLANGNAVPGSTSIIIIPMNNNVVGKPQSHVIESLDKPIILYIPSTQSSGNPSQTLPSKQYVSLLLENPVPNDELFSGLSNMAPLQNDGLSSNVLASELLNSISDSGSSLPMCATLPTNSTCYNNESSPSSMREKSFANNLIHKSLTGNAPLVIPARDEKCLKNQSLETYINTDTLPQTPNFEHPLFDFAGSDLTSLSHGPYNNILNNESPIIVREINSNQQITNGSSKDLFIPTQNVTSEYSQKNNSTDSVLEVFFSNIPNDAPAVVLNKNYSSETTTHISEIFKENTPLPNSPSNLQVPTDNSISPPPIFKKLTESLPQPIDKMLIPTPLIETEMSLTSIPLSETVSDKLPVIIDEKLPPTQVLEITTDNVLQSIDKTLALSPILDSSPKVTNNNMTLNIALLPELYKIRQLIDKMLSSEPPIERQLPPIDTTLAPVLDSNSARLSISRSLQPKKTAPDSLPLFKVDKTHLPPLEPDNPINNVRLQVPEMLSPIPVDETSEDNPSLPLDNLLLNTPLETVSLPPPMDETVLPIPVSETSIDNKPYLVDNLVTPLSETATFRTKDSLKNGVPSKMDLMIPDIYEVSSDDLPLSDNDLLILEHQEHTANPDSRVSVNDWPMEVVETLTPIPKVPVSDSLDPTEQSSLLGELLEPSLPVQPVNAANSGANSLPLNNLKSSDLEKSSDVVFLEATFSDIPYNEFLLPVDKKLLRTDKTSTAYPLPINETPSTTNLPITKALLENVLSDITKGGLSSPIAKPLPVISPLLDKTHYCVDEKSPLTVTKEISVLPVEKICPIMEHIHKPIDYLPISEKSEDTSTSYFPTDLPLPVDDIYKKTPDFPTNDVKDINEDVDIESSLSDISKDHPPLPVDNILPNRALYDLVNDNNNLQDSGQSHYTLPIEVDNLLPEISSLDIPKEISTPTTKILPNSNEGLTSPMAEILPPSTGTPSDRPFSNNKTPSSLKLPITKALLENVLADINTQGFSLPKAKVLPVAPRSQLDKTFYFLESPLSDISTEYVPVLEINKEVSSLPIGKKFPDDANTNNPTDNKPIDQIYEKKSDILTKEAEEEDLNELLSSDNPTGNNDDLPTLMDKQLPITDTLDEPPIPRSKPRLDSRIPITKEILERVLSDITDGGFSAKNLPITSLSKLPTKTYRKTK